jgi:hypothetical protein
MPQVSIVTNPLQTGVYLNQTSGELADAGTQKGMPVEGVAQRVVPQ